MERAKFALTLIAAAVAAGISGCSEKKEQVTKKEVVVTPAAPPAKGKAAGKSGPRARSR